MSSLDERKARLKQVGVEMQGTPEYSELSEINYQYLKIVTRQRELQIKLLGMTRQRLENIPKTVGVKERLMHETHLLGAVGLMSAIDSLAEDKL